MSLEDDLRTAADRFVDFQEEVETLVQSALRRASWRARHGFKVCCVCHERKRPTEFGSDASRADGLDVRCRACRRKPRP